MSKKELSEEQKEFQKENRKIRKIKVERSVEQSRHALRRKVRMFYDTQALRTQIGNRTFVKEDDPVPLHEHDLMILERGTTSMHFVEKETLRFIESHLKGIPLYTEFLQGIKGIGPTLAGVIISEIDITKCNTVSALWKYAGCAPIDALRCKHCHDTVTKTKDGFKHEYNRKEKCPHEGKLNQSDVYESKKAERPTRGQKIGYNPFLKTKMLGVAADCLIKANSPYRKFYDDYKHRLESAGRGRDKNHRHRMAIRYMIKMLLKDIWVEWRTREGLEVRPSYQEQYLGHVHHA